MQGGGNFLYIGMARIRLNVYVNGRDHHTDNIIIMLVNLYYNMLSFIFLTTEKRGGVLSAKAITKQCGFFGGDLLFCYHLSFLFDIL